MNERDPEVNSDSLSEALGYDFRAPSLAELALSHPSYAHEVDGSRGNERLEFLGDAVLDLAIAEILFQTHPDWSEGDLTRSRAALVNQQALADRARTLGLDRFVQLGRTERRTDGQRKASVLSNCLEAVIGAMYLDGGLPVVLGWVGRVFGDDMTAGGGPERRDAKTRFQEWAHAHFRSTPVYRTVRDSGKDNDEERFTVEVAVGDDVWGTGVGRSKRMAEREAATAALANEAALDD